MHVLITMTSITTSALAGTTTVLRYGNVYMIKGPSPPTSRISQECLAPKILDYIKTIMKVDHHLSDKHLVIFVMINIIVLSPS